MVILICIVLVGVSIYSVILGVIIPQEFAMSKQTTTQKTMEEIRHVLGLQQTIHMEDGEVVHANGYTYQVNISSSSNSRIVSIEYQQAIHSKIGFILSDVQYKVERGMLDMLNQLK